MCVRYTIIFQLISKSVQIPTVHPIQGVFTPRTQCSWESPPQPLPRYGYQTGHNKTSMLTLVLYYSIAPSFEFYIFNNPKVCIPDKKPGTNRMFSSKHDRFTYWWSTSVHLHIYRIERAVPGGKKQIALPRKYISFSLSSSSSPSQADIRFCTHLSHIPNSNWEFGLHHCCVNHINKMTTEFSILLTELAGVGERFRVERYLGKKCVNSDPTHYIGHRFGHPPFCTCPKE